jgi:hypothetical protein
MITATSDKPERQFGDTGRIVYNRRDRLENDTITANISLKSCTRKGVMSWMKASVEISAVKGRLVPNLRLKSADQFSSGSEPHIREVQVRTNAGVGGKHHSQNLSICLKSTCSCLLVGNLCLPMRLASSY